MIVVKWGSVWGAVAFLCFSVFLADMTRSPYTCHTGGKGFCIGITINRETATKLHQLSHRETRMSGSEISDTTLKMPQCSRVPESVAVTVVNSVHSIALPNELMASLCVCVCVCVFVCVAQSYLEPVYFYIYTVFSLQAVYVIALYLTAWLLSGSWLAGALTGVWYILNRWVITICVRDTVKEERVSPFLLALDSVMAVFLSI